MHKVSGVLCLDGDQPEEVRAATDFSLSLTMPFVKASAPLEPINPGWKPSSEGSFFSMGSILETTAGPTIGAAADLIELFIASRQAATGKLSGEEGSGLVNDACRPPHVRCNVMNCRKIGSRRARFMQQVGQPT